jgi:hypothetical protein
MSEAIVYRLRLGCGEPLQSRLLRTRSELAMSARGRPDGALAWAVPSSFFARHWIAAAATGRARE